MQESCHGGARRQGLFVGFGLNPRGPLARKDPEAGLEVCVWGPWARLRDSSVYLLLDIHKAVAGILVTASSVSDMLGSLGVPALDTATLVGSVVSVLAWQGFPETQTSLSGYTHRNAYCSSWRKDIA